jgi:hypothetical protein
MTIQGAGSLVGEGSVMKNPQITLPPDINALVSVNSSGRTQMFKLFTKDQPIEEYAKEHYSPR